MYTYEPTIKRVIDGDTFVCDIDLGFNILIRNKSVRVAHVNAPEKNTPEGQQAKAYTESMLSQGNVTLTILDHKGDKYGRLLAEVSIGSRRLDRCMVEDGHGKPYEGGKKE
jgi:endonuclease YncB( thermonuclease family)